MPDSDGPLPADADGQTDADSDGQTNADSEALTDADSATPTTAADTDALTTDADTETSTGDDSNAEWVAIVACDVFEDALRRFAAQYADVGGCNLDLRFLDIRYHSDYDGMESAIRETTERARASGADRVLVGYGAVCHPEMERIVAESDAELLPTVNCIDAFAGAETHAEVFRDDLLFVTPGWLEKLLPSARANPARFADLDRIVFQNPVDVDRAANDSGDAPVEDRLAELAELTGLPVERREGDPTVFGALLREALAE